MSAADFLKKLPSAFNPDEASGTNCTINFACSKPVNVVINNGTCVVNDGTAGNADLTITMEDDDLIALMKGELNGMTAFMTGKLQVDGDLMLAQRMASFFDASKL
ncbi:sterol-binding protein [Solimonas sp. K1W22B-7]|uniref:SCP2 sterol-binding domain-containing protein n=1 Tax=Solimonas sp. K1W22B-7 TaxID=2303331 RepID=UPI000E32FD6F|nr:SCP2 sterol-binding domain-containing protein [Solimonas sp. K1W22B-7]AXQ29184.1 sterol-binding protein [Solimonas sp. K1W22B-7]